MGFVINPLSRSKSRSDERMYKVWHLIRFAHHNCLRISEKVLVFQQENGLLFVGPFPLSLFRLLFVNTRDMKFVNRRCSPRKLRSRTAREWHDRNRIDWKSSRLFETKNKRLKNLEMDCVCPTTIWKKNNSNGLISKCKKKTNSVRLILRIRPNMDVDSCLFSMTTPSGPFIACTFPSTSSFYLSAFGLRNFGERTHTNGRQRWAEHSAFQAITEHAYASHGGRYHFFSLVRILQ